MPRVDHFEKSEAVSSSTVLLAYRALEEAKLVHKQGGTWLVGLEPEPRDIDRAGAWPVVFVLQARPAQWGALGRSDRFEKFCRAFVDESEKHQVQLVPVLAGETARGDYVAGMDAVCGAARAYGDRYLGTVIFSTPVELPEVRQWITALTDLGQPVLWFDRNDDDGEGMPRSPLFTRCRYNEPDAVRVALEHLTELGHTRIGFAAFTDVPWRHSRRRLVIHTADALKLPVTLVTRGTQSDFLEELAPQDAEQLVGEIEKRSPMLKQLMRSAFASRLEVESKFGSRGYRFSGKSPGEQYRLLFQFIEQYGAAEGTALLGLSRADIRALAITPLLSHLVLHEKVTGLIAASDADARNFHEWLVRFGLTPGKEVSLVGFDNYWLPEQTPVTTVDFGFGYLGYAAFHAIHGTVPLERDRNGDIAARPHMVYRGSTGVRGKPAF